VDSPSIYSFVRSFVSLASLLSLVTQLLNRIIYFSSTSPVGTETVEGHVYSIMALSPSSTVPIGASLVKPTLLEHHNSHPQEFSWKGLAEIKDNKMLVYETDTQQLRQINCRELQASYKGITRLLPSTKAAMC
jgi:hypothetical protein